MLRYRHTMVRVANVEKSLDFYVTKLGLKETRRIDNQQGRFTLIFELLLAQQRRFRLARKRLHSRAVDWVHQYRQPVHTVPVLNSTSTQ